MLSSISDSAEHSTVLADRIALGSQLFDDEKRLEMIKSIKLSEINSAQFLNTLFDDARKCTLYIGGSPSNKSKGMSRERAAIINNYELYMEG